MASDENCGIAGTPCMSSDSSGSSSEDDTTEICKCLAKNEKALRELFTKLVGSVTDAIAANGKLMAKVVRRLERVITDSGKQSEQRLATVYTQLIDSTRSRVAENGIRLQMLRDRGGNGQVGNGQPRQVVPVGNDVGGDLPALPPPPPPPPDEQQPEQGKCEGKQLSSDVKKVYRVPYGNDLGEDGSIFSECAANTIANELKRSYPASEALAAIRGNGIEGIDGLYPVDPGQPPDIFEPLPPVSAKPFQELAISQGE